MPVYTSRYQPSIKLFNEDNMAVMARYPDQYFDLAIADPPYFSKLKRKSFYGSSKTKIPRSTTECKYWGIPNEDYFIELYRISKNQIIWGCNYYAKHIPHCGRIVWDKKNDKAQFSKAEIASQSFSQGVAMFRHLWNGMIQEPPKEQRIHPTQKPVRLYKWLFETYAKPGQQVIDTHFGSLSSGIAAHYFGCNLVACEIDPAYYAAGVARFEQETMQIDMFSPDTKRKRKENYASL